MYALKVKASWPADCTMEDYIAGQKAIAANTGYLFTIREVGKAIAYSYYHREPNSADYLSFLHNGMKWVEYGS